MTSRYSCSGATVGVAVGLIATALASCTSPQSPATIPPPPFAITYANIVYPEGEQYPINLIFTAKEDDPIWSRLSGVALSDEVSLTPGEFDVIRGDVVDGMALGNITFELAVPHEELSFNIASLFYEGDPDPVEVNVGDWSLRAESTTAFVTEELDTEVAALADCTRVALPVPSSVASIDEVGTGVAGVTVEAAAFEPVTSSVEVTLRCSDAADFFVISPTIKHVDGDGKHHDGRLSPIAIGLQSIDAADMERISSR